MWVDGRAAWLLAVCLLRSLTALPRLQLRPLPEKQDGWSFGIPRRMHLSLCSAALGSLDLFQAQQMTNHPLLLADNGLSIKPCFCMVTLL